MRKNPKFNFKANASIFRTESIGRVSESSTATQGMENAHNIHLDRNLTCMKCKQKEFLRNPEEERIC